MAGSNGTRMAGEELSKADRHKRARERIGNDPERLAERLSGIDREAYDFEGYSDKEINMAMQGGTFDENDYARLTGNPIADDDRGDDNDGGDNGTKPPAAEEDPVVTIPTPVEEEEGPKQTIQPVIGPGRGPYGGMTQNINQDNDIVSNVTGSGNTVTNTQDNSIKQYGGGGSWTNAWMKDYFS